MESVCFPKLVDFRRRTIARNVQLQFCHRGSIHHASVVRKQIDMYSGCGLRVRLFQVLVARLVQMNGLEFIAPVDIGAGCHQQVFHVAKSVFFQSSAKLFSA